MEHIDEFFLVILASSGQVLAVLVSSGPVPVILANSSQVLAVLVSSGQVPVILASSGQV